MEGLGLHLRPTSHCQRSNMHIHYRQFATYVPLMLCILRATVLPIPQILVARRQVAFRSQICMHTRILHHPITSLIQSVGPTDGLKFLVRPTSVCQRYLVSARLTDCMPLKASALRATMLYMPQTGLAQI
jgi:hypothetical protein